ncbi:NADPH-dependent FMN reductase [Pseudoroseomonas deserti]|uniref:NADPH-dependent FMN reductase n=2 Tax=Teichococcus deserti TaxID=1817963 RepID=A0A1V2GXJ4_9PROT|nr:NADPH-dependent FMN reductase [Pseudoroseomonas deserti]
MAMTTILAISGSLRRQSTNTALLRAAGQLLPAGASLILHGLADIPMYDDDVRQQGYPAPVEALRRAVAAADAVLIATPEYNRSFSGVLKNALDWVSRPPAAPLAGKAVGVVGVSPGALGTGVAHYQLKHVLTAMGAFVVPGAEVMVGHSAQKFDTEGRLTDEATQKFLAAHLERLIDLARRLR